MVGKLDWIDRGALTKFILSAQVFLIPFDIDSRMRRRGG
jgi:hypothetical protein